MAAALAVAWVAPGPSGAPFVGGSSRGGSSGLHALGWQVDLGWLTVGLGTPAVGLEGVDAGRADFSRVGARLERGCALTLAWRAPEGRLGYGPAILRREV